MTKYVLLFGGVGNRLFQLARANDLKSNGHKVIIVELEDCCLLSILCYRFLGWTKHPIWLDTSSLCRALDIQKCKRDYMVKLKIYVGIFVEIVIKRSVNFNSNVIDDNRIIHIGYFQGKNSITIDSVLKISNRLSSILDLKQREAREILHIRAGDFSEKDRISSALVDDFRQNFQNCTVVTDDSDYVKKTYPDLQVLKAGSPITDFKLIATSHMILPSDSTFCFWACAIAKNIFDAKISVFPESAFWHHLSDETN